MATTPSLPSANSIIDYLDTAKKDSSFTARRKSYNDFGFSTRLGDYVGSPNQNTSLLKELQRRDTAANQTPLPATSTPATNTLQSFNTAPSTPSVSSALISPQPQTTSVAQALVGPQAPAPTAAGTLQKIQGTAPQIPAPTGLGLLEPKMAQTPQTPAPASTPTQTPTLAGTSSKSQETDATTKNLTGVSASTLYPGMFGDTAGGQSEADLVNEYLNSPEGKIFLDRQNLKADTQQGKDEATKQALEAKYAADKTKLEQNLAEHGLAFSGIRATQVKALADTLASSELGVDRAFASQLLNANIDLRDAIFKGVAQLAAKAATKEKDAVSQLNSLGYAVINGKLVPNLSKQNFDLATQREARLQNGSGSSGNKLTYSEASSRGLPLSLVGMTEEEVVKSFYDTKPPKWFVDKVNSEHKQTVSPDAVQALWDTQSQKYLTGAKESADHAKAVSYFKQNFGEDISAQDIQDYADAVDNYMAAGLSYRDALLKVDPTAGQ